MASLDLAPFYARHHEHTPTPPDVRAVQVARAYVRAHNILSPTDTLPSVGVPDAVGAARARAYDALPLIDPSALPLWRVFGDETMAQYRYLLSAGYCVHVVQDDPYATPADMRADVARGQIAVMATATTGHHPALADHVNDAFRAVHDVFGHAATGRGFDRHGEDAAYAHHATMYGPIARAVLATETRGQNSALVWGDNGFPTQRIAILPQHLRIA